jgi:hypothetical protein
MPAKFKRPRLRPQPLFAFSAPNAQAERTAGETEIPAVSQLSVKTTNHMGDKSPKSNTKKAGQKTAAVTKAVATKKASVAAKAVKPAAKAAAKPAAKKK